MKKFKYNKDILSLLCPLIIGAASFFLVVGPRILNPKNIAWLNGGDPWTHYLGWSFFRYSSWSFPIGLNPNYGLEISNSIIFSDSIPLMAFIFKPFSPLLPEPFQYLGIWLLLCFILQAFFSWKILSLITENSAIRFLGTLLLVFSPPMIWRLQGHLSLTSHFLIMASLYMYFKPGSERRKLAWITILGATALVHAYLLAINAAIWITDLITKKINNNMSAKEAGLELVLIILTTGFFCWQAGYFTIGDSAASGGYGLYAMNILSLIDPSGWSYVIKDIPENGGNYEGFNYLGLGVIFLWACALPVFFECTRKIMHKVKNNYPLIILMVFITAFAVTNNINLGKAQLNFTLPDIIIKQAGIFRSSGRMFWPAFYLLVLSAIYLVARGYEKRAAIPLLALAIFIQTADTHAVWGRIRNNMMIDPGSAWNTPFKDPFWELAAQKYAKVRNVCGGRPSKEIAAYAATHRMATDSAYLARVNSSAHKAWMGQWQVWFDTGRFDEDSLHIVNEACNPKALLNLNSTTDLFAEIDGFFVIAPNWRQLGQPAGIEVKFDAILPPVSANKYMPTNKQGLGLPYLISGWSSPESWGTWSDGEKASIILPLKGGRPEKIVIEAISFVGPAHPSQNIYITINGEHTFTFTTTAENVFEINIPDSVYKAESFAELIKIDFYFPDATAPIDLELSGDTRKLAMGIKSISVN
ncbi:hypothetical protein C4J81_19170 (plasmid) [Deltaproteobacteria bacterium Smac51]|nr:hypothetical protein C4J81_19170 [Deltaproteobacteria bacterium Smac51]